MTEQIKKLAQKLTQVAPYIIKVAESDEFALVELGKATGSSVRQIVSNDGRQFLRVSDPLCYMLERAGMNE